jgi:ribonuclease PH
MKRSDNREPDELRPVTIEPNYLAYAEGSALVCFGNTKVICAATVEDRQPPFLRGTSSGWVTAEYSMLPRSTLTRTRREVSEGRPSGRTQEIQRLVGRSLRAVTNMDLLGERTVTLDCDVLQADGGTRTASITGAYVALIIALERLAAKGVISPGLASTQVAAVSVGIVDGVALLDLAYDEDFRAEVDSNVVMTSAGEFVELQATAEHGNFGRPALDRMLELSEAGIRRLFAIQQAALGQALG